MVRDKHSMKYGLHDPAHEGTMTLWSTVNYLLSDTYHSGRFESSATQLLETQISHNLLGVDASRQTTVQCHI